MAENTRESTGNVEHPAHYGSRTGMECIDAIRAALDPREFRGYCKGNALKYVWRESGKGHDEDLMKAAWYLREAVEPHNAKLVREKREAGHARSAID